MLELTACPECAEPAEILHHDWLGSTDGPVEHVRIQCIARHWFYLPLSSLPAWTDDADDAVDAGTVLEARRER